MVILWLEAGADEELRPMAWQDENAKALVQEILRGSNLAVIGLHH